MGPIVSRDAVRGSVGGVDLEVEFRDGVSLRRQLEDALRVAIRSGRLAPGSVLPPSRDLAEQLSVSRGVVVDSYAQLATEGYLSARRGSGTRVAATAASGRPPARRRQLPPPQMYRYELRPGTADFRAFPRAAWKAALVRALRELPDGRLTYADHRGVPSSGTPSPDTWPACAAWLWTPSTWSSAARPPRR
jgi:GntR family transcriptional regulator/MocR family aminotransferase